MDSLSLGKPSFAETLTYWRNLLTASFTMRSIIWPTKNLRKGRLPCPRNGLNYRIMLIGLSRRQCRMNREDLSNLCHARVPV